MRNCLLLILLDVAGALAQPAAIVEDLQQRALAEIDHLAGPETWNEALRSQKPIRARIEQSLNLGRPLPVGPGSAFLYAPPGATATPAPAVILVRPHQDPTAAESRRIPATITRMGMFVLELDARAYHSKLDLLADGVLPQSLIQRDVRIALAYLKGSSEVDPKRLAIGGEGLAATVAAAVNTDLSAAVLLQGAPDFKSLIKDLRSSPPDQMPDPCDLLPGLLQYAATGQLLSLIAPRPLLLIDAAAGPLEYATRIYRSSGSRQKVGYLIDGEWTPAARFAAYAWLARSLEGRSDVSDLREPDLAPEPVRLALTAPAPTAPVVRSPVSEQLLTSLLGAPLPEGTITFGLNCRGNQHLSLYPQSNIQVPATVVRPGPDECGSSSGTLIAVDDRGRASLKNDEIVQEALRRGWVVWMLDPRGIGELKTNSEPFVFAVSLLLGENTAWRQAADIYRVLRHEGIADPHDSTGLYARGRNMTIAASYVAAIASRRELSWIVLRDAASTFRGLTDVAPSVVPFDVMKYFDLAGVRKAAKGEILLIDRAEEALNREW